MNKSRISGRSKVAFFLNSSPFSLGIMISLTTRSISPGLFSKIRIASEPSSAASTGVAAFLQRHGNQTAQGWFVLDYEHRFGAGEDLGFQRWRLIFYLQFGHCRRRQVNAEPAALS